jgi:hypothetical protein
MLKKRLFTHLTLLFFIVYVPLALGLKSEDIIRLKKAGLEDETIRLLIREKSIETGAFTTQEILALKKAGLNDETIRLLVKENSFLKDREPIVYGRDVRPIKLTSSEDIIRLKKAGVSDEVIKAILTALNSQNADERDRAWRMLERLEIRIDKRGAP